ncbi:MAG: hypothetical protein HUJ61_07485 [Bacilli bacterium]|nr:hypothetical protein [Bacilli bacterium]
MTSPEGCVSNQIPQSGSITFAIDTTEKRIEEQDIEDLQKKEEDVLTYQYVAEKTAKLDFHEITENKPTHVLSINDSYNIFGFLTHLSNGIYIPESMPRYHSSQNCAPITFKINDDGDKASFDVSVYARSFNNKILDYL